MNEEMSNKSYEPSEAENKSLDLLHEGQEAASDGDLEMARDKVEKSLAIARKGDDLKWITYLKGMLAYMDGNLAKLKSHIADAGNNAKILSHLADGLENRGTPDYKEDYRD